DVTLNAEAGGARPVVTVKPARAVRNANWFDFTTWQGRRSGDGGLVIAPLHAVTTDDGVVYTTNRPVPVSGSWKALIRLHKGRELGVVPVFLPADPAIPAPAFAPTQHYRGAFVANKRSCNGRQ